jgi:hypothetical protein
METRKHHNRHKLPSSASDSLIRRLTPPGLRKKDVMYTKLAFNPDPLTAGSTPWQVFLVPNTEISLTMRVYLEAAHDSNQREPLRECECMAFLGEKCSVHPLPDMVAKFFGCYMLEPAMGTITNEHVGRLTRQFAKAELITTPGVWRRYRIIGEIHDELEPSITYRYKFRMFY